MFKRKLRSVGDNECFVRLLRAAQEDRTFRAMLCGILRQPSFHRKSLLNTMAADMSADGEEEDMIRAVTALTDDAVAERALEMLKD
ncbi:MAG: hypothetical protein HOK80_10805 [Candidatus Cloacimonetes bacterium]|jgi:hypothetical protein|nr:hypothetical protein [Candidatus Cloacimonadota bacterium]